MQLRSTSKVDKAFNLYRNGQFDDAVKLFEEIISYDKRLGLTNYICITAKARCLINLNKLDEAMKLLKSQVAPRNPRDICDVNMTLANCYMTNFKKDRRKQHLVNAEICLNKIPVEKIADKKDFFLTKANLYKHQHNYNDAIRLLEKLNKEHPKDIKILTSLIDNYGKVNNKEKIESLSNQAKAILKNKNPSHIATQNALKILYFNSPEKAEDLLNKATANNSVKINYDMLMQQATTYSKEASELDKRILSDEAKEKHSEAVKLFEKIIKENPYYWKAYVGYAVCLSHLSEDNKQEKYLNKVINFDKKLPINLQPTKLQLAQSWHLLAQYNLHEGKIEKYRECVNNGLKEVANYAPLLSEKAKDERVFGQKNQKFEESKTNDPMRWQNLHGQTTSYHGDIQTTDDSKKQQKNVKSKGKNIIKKDNYKQSEPAFTIEEPSFSKTTLNVESKTSLSDVSSITPPVKSGQKKKKKNKSKQKPIVAEAQARVSCSKLTLFAVTTVVGVLSAATYQYTKGLN